MTYYTDDGTLIIEHYEDEPSGPFCKRCGCEMDWEDCGACEEGEIDGYELDPMWYDPGDTYPCQQCGGDGGWWICTNSACPLKG